jgi:hypothetical protein
VSNDNKGSATNILFDLLGMEGVIKFNNSILFFLYLHAGITAEWPITEKGQVKKKKEENKLHKQKAKQGH